MFRVFFHGSCPRARVLLSQVRQRWLVSLVLCGHERGPSSGLHFVGEESLSERCHEEIQNLGHAVGETWCSRSPWDCDEIHDFPLRFGPSKQLRLKQLMVGGQSCGLVATQQIMTLQPTVMSVTRHSFVCQANCMAYQRDPQ